MQVVKDNKGHADVPAIISTPHHYLISILRNNLYFVAVCMSEGCIYFLISLTMLKTKNYFVLFH